MKPEINKDKIKDKPLPKVDKEALERSIKKKDKDIKQNQTIRK
jgi:hypothetical protein